MLNQSTFYLCFLITLTTFTNTFATTLREKINKDLSYEDFAHEFKGCPENSKCSKEMGIKLQAEKFFFQSLRDIKSNTEKSKKIQARLSTEGLSFTFLINKPLAETLNAVVFQSPCKEHRQPNIKDELFKGIVFIKDITSQSIVVSKASEDISIKNNENIFGNPTYIQGSSPITYFVPQEASLLYVEGSMSYYLIEKEENYFLLEFSAKGIEAKPVPDSIMSFIDKTQEVECSDDLKKIKFNYFYSSVCKDLTLNQGLVHTKLFSSCN